MKLVTFSVEGRTRPGIWTDQGVIDLGRDFPDASGLHDLVSHSMSNLRQFADRDNDYGHESVRLEKPLLSWGKCFCVGVNYADRNAEYRDGTEAPKYPSLFIRFAESFVGPGADVVVPLESAQLDYEGEIAIVIGKAGRRIAATAARDHIWGYTLANEGSVRDWVRHGKFNVTPGKNFAASGALGPWIVPTSDVPDRLRLTTRINGSLRQDDDTERMMFPMGTILSYISSFCTLEPGDVILTGTPNGAGIHQNPPVFLKQGDRIDVTVEEIGTLSTGVVTETAT